MVRESHYILYFFAVVYFVTKAYYFPKKRSTVTVLLYLQTNKKYFPELTRFE